jgi:FtsP/CotA-like multicopper oxidase with cupredoxin domain
LDVVPTEGRPNTPRPALLVVVFGMALACSGTRTTLHPEAEPTSGRGSEGRPAGGRLTHAPELEGAYPVEARPKGRVREFAIRAAPVVVPLFDGKEVAVWAYNGKVPGPTLRVRLGETLRVRFRNDLPQPSTIHWHGVRVPNAMDGVPGVTQPPVLPGGEFVYEFTPKDAGTYWFHPHVRASEQVERGLFGVLVVEDERPPPYSRELVLVLDDWLVDSASRIVEKFNTPHELAHDGRWGNVITVNGRTLPNIELLPGERVRLRLVNVANARVFALGFEGLDARVIAVDGLYTARPLDPAGFMFAPGNRLDVDVTVPADAAGRSWTVTDQFSRLQTQELLELLDRRKATSPAARLRQRLPEIRDVPLLRLDVADRAPVATPNFPTPARAHVPAWSDAAERPTRADFTLASRPGGELGIQWTINGQAFDHQAHRSGGADLAVLPGGAWSKLRFTNKSTRIHPMHLHGSFFKLLTRNGAPVDEPFFRDTVLVSFEETIEIGLVPVDRGRWMMHCHILEHAESGMMALLRVE